MTVNHREWRRALATVTGPTLPCLGLWRRARSFALPVLVLVVQACGPQGQPESTGSVDVAPGDFAAFYHRIGTLQLHVPDTTPLVRVSGLAFGPGGQFLIADVSEANVKWFDARGALVRVLGRRGNGPREFGQPRFPRFGADGRVYVADAGQNRMTVFDSTGVVVRVTDLDGFSPVMGFAVLRDGGFVLSGNAGGTDVVHVADSTGRIIRRFLGEDRTRPRSGPESAFWRPVTQHWLAVAGDTVIVASTLSDSLWRIPLATGAITATRLIVPGYVDPVVLHEVPRDVRAMMAWQKSFHIAATVLASSRQIVVPFVQGVLNYGDPLILVARGSDGVWRALTGAPPSVAVNGDSLVMLEDPDAEIVTLGFYLRARP